MVIFHCDVWVVTPSFGKPDVAAFPRSKAPSFPQMAGLISAAEMMLKAVGLMVGWKSPMKKDGFNGKTIGTHGKIMENIGKI